VAELSEGIQNVKEPAHTREKSVASGGWRQDKRRGARGGSKSPWILLQRLVDGKEKTQRR